MNLIPLLFLGALGYAVYKFSDMEDLTDTNYRFDENDFISAFRKIINEGRFNESIFPYVERIYRKETRNFDSLQYRKTGSPGMEAHGERQPWGWRSLLWVWRNNAELKPVGVIKMRENVTGIEKPFLVFPSVYAAIYALCVYLEKYPPARWYTTDKGKQAIYTRELNKITPTIYNQLTT